ncbi:MAG: TetR/AcrR family transcriptional regulator [Christensenellales bacterium]
MSNTPKTIRGQATMNRIIKAAEQLFGKRGYHNTSMNEIATRAKVALGTIYIYFDDKYSLYCHLLTQYGHYIRQEIAKATLDCRDRYTMERQGLLAFLLLVRKRPYMYNIIWESLYINPELFVAYYESFARRYKTQLDKAAGEVTSMNNTVLAYVLMGIANFIGLKYVFFDKQADLEQVVDEVMKVYSQGILTAPKADA